MATGLIVTRARWAGRGSHHDGWGLSLTATDGLPNPTDNGGVSKGATYMNGAPMEDNFLPLVIAVLILCGMGALEPWMDENFIKNIFSTVAGETVNVKVIRDRNSGILEALFNDNTAMHLARGQQSWLRYQLTAGTPAGIPAPAPVAPMDNGAAPGANMALVPLGPGVPLQLQVPTGLSDEPPHNRSWG